MPPQEQTSPRFAMRLFDGAARGYEAQAHVLSFGQYARWHARLVDRAREAGIGAASRVLDVATGTGLIAQRLGQTLRCAVTGLDQSAGMLQRARERFNGTGNGNGNGRVPLVRANADRLPFASDRFDGLTYSYLLRYVDDPAHTVAELVRTVRPGGFVGMVEFHRPPQPVARGAWRLHTRVNLPLAGKLYSKGWSEVGSFLGPSIERFADDWPLERLGRLHEDAGLQDVRVEAMSLGGGIVISGTKEA